MREYEKLRCPECGEIFSEKDVRRNIKKYGIMECQNCYKDDEPAEISDKARRVKRQIRSIKDDKQTSLFDMGDTDG